MRPTPPSPAHTHLPARPPGQSSGSAHSAQAHMAPRLRRERVSSVSRLVPCPFSKPPSRHKRVLSPSFFQSYFISRFDCHHTGPLILTPSTPSTSILSTVHSTCDMEVLAPRIHSPETWVSSVALSPSLPRPRFPAKRTAHRFPNAPGCLPPHVPPGGSFCLNVLRRVLAGDPSSRATSADLRTPASSSATGRWPRPRPALPATPGRGAVYLSSRRLLQHLPLPSEPVFRRCLVCGIHQHQARPPAPAAPFRKKY